MKIPYMFFTIVVSGPDDPTQGIDVYLQPLIEELKTLWLKGVEAYEISQKGIFVCSLLYYGLLVIFMHMGYFQAGE